jgi:predicted nucleotidyltransferase
MIFDVEKEISDLTQQIIEKYKPKKVILFGSAARGEWTPDSDADFLIIKDEIPLLGADRMREISRIIDRNISVDFLIYRSEEFNRRLQMGDPFLKNIIKEGKVLYG